jgi:transposase
MAKIRTKAVFKKYTQNEYLLLPPNLGELIPEKHLVRVVNEVIEQMDLTVLYNEYKGGGTSSYHPKMLLKVMLYAYSVKIYTGRKIAKALTQDINFMWLSGMSRPDFRTVNHFRSSKAKEVIESLFKEMLEFLINHEYVKMENYFCDGTPVLADGNKHKMVWKKNAERYEASTKTKCEELFKQIDALNEQEEKEYKEKDLEEHGTSQEISKEKIQEQIKKLNDTINTTSDKRKKAKAESLKKKAEQAQDRLKKYENQQEIAGKRSGYNKTDPDATGMMMKNHVEILPAYNVLAGCEDQFIIGISLHQNTNDGTCFAEHAEHMSKQQPQQPKNLIGDSIFGTEQNYELLQEKGIENYMKFNTFHSEEKDKFKNNPFLKENFKYDSQNDLYICPNNRELKFIGIRIRKYKSTGYESKQKEYKCESCKGCPYIDECCKSDKGENRSLSFSEKLEKHKEQARKNLKSEKGIKLRKQRGYEIESCFGDMKHNMGFRRTHLRGKEKVFTEIVIVAIAHNLRKINIKREQKAA